jgi:hypothetical protein
MGYWVGEPRGCKWLGQGNNQIIIASERTNERAGLLWGREENLSSATKCNDPAFVEARRVYCVEGTSEIQVCYSLFYSLGV